MRQSVRTYVKVVLNLLTALVVLLLCIFLLPRVIWFFMPFIVGWVIALIASPAVRFFEEKLKVKRKAVSAFVIIAVLAAVVMLVYAVGTKLVEEIMNFVNELPSIWNGVMDELDKVGQSLDVIYAKLPKDTQETWHNVTLKLEEYLDNFMGSINAPSFRSVGNAAKQIPDIFLGLIMCLLSSYFFVADKNYMSEAAKKIVPDAILYRFDLLRRSFRRVVGGYFKAQFKIEFWIYILLTLGLLILNVRYAFLVALGIAVLDFFPVFGTGTVMIPWAVIGILSGEYKMAVGLLIIWCVSQLVRQVIQPKIVGDSMGMDAIPTLFLLYIGYKVAGVLGMLLAVPIGIIVVNLYEEGVFDTTRQSIRILSAGFNRFRKIRPEDMAIITDYQHEVERDYQQEMEHEKEEEEEMREASQLKIEEPPIIKKIIAKKSKDKE